MFAIVKSMMHAGFPCWTWSVKCIQHNYSGPILSMVSPETHFGTFEAAEHVPLLFKVCSSPKRGRHVHAACDLAPGVELWREQAFAAVMLEECHLNFCHFCWRPCDGRFSGPLSPLVCRGCNWACYCSAECRLEDSVEHGLLCPFLGLEAHKIADEATVTVNRVRLLLKCLAVKYLERAALTDAFRFGTAERLPPTSSLSSPEDAAFDPSDEPSPKSCGEFLRKKRRVISGVLLSRLNYQDTLFMVSNQDRFRRDWILCVERAANLIFEAVPKKLRVLSTADLVRLACLSDTNSFGITVEWAQYELCRNLKQGFEKSSSLAAVANRPPVIALSVAGLGIYPLCARLNHSCYPSCEFRLAVGGPSNCKIGGAPLSMCTLRIIKNGQELTDSYVDLYTDRITRRAELLRTKHFLCNCERCTVPISTSPDRYLDGIICPNCCVGKTSASDTALGQKGGDVDQPILWNIILAEVGNCLIRNSPPSLYLWRAIAAVLVDIAELDFWWAQKQPHSLDRLVGLDPSINISDSLHDGDVNSRGPDVTSEPMAEPTSNLMGKRNSPEKSPLLSADALTTTAETTFSSSDSGDQIGKSPNGLQLTGETGDLLSAEMSGDSGITHSEATEMDHSKCADGGPEIVTEAPLIYDSDDDRDIPATEFERNYCTPVSRKPKFPALYDPSTVPVLLPPGIDEMLGFTVCENLERVFLLQGGYPDNITTREYTCEKCKTAFKKASLESRLDAATRLQSRVCSSLQSGEWDLNTCMKLRRESGLFFRLFASTLRHPFHSSLYRISQRVVDTTTALLGKLAQAGDDMTPVPVELAQDSKYTTQEAPCQIHAESVWDKRMQLLLLDVVLLRYQFACQSYVMPAFHEEKFLTLRLLVVVLRQFSDAVGSRRNEDCGCTPPPNAVIDAARRRCENLYRLSRSVTLRLLGPNFTRLPV